MSSSNAEILKNFIGIELKKEDEQDLGIKAAERLLGITSVEKEFERLKDSTLESLFQYEENKERRELRPYQTEALIKLEAMLKEGKSTVAVQLPTGAGKTFLVHSFVYKNLLQKRRNVLVIVPSWEIANQHAATVCQNFKDGSQRVRRLGGRGQLISALPEFKAGEKGKVIVTTSSLFYARKNALVEWLKVGLVVIDEGHYGWKKKRLNAVLEFAEKVTIPSVLLTATPPQNMETLPFAVQLSYLDLVPEYLVKCQVVRLETGEEFSPILKNGILSQKSRQELSSRDTRFEAIVSQSLKHIKGQTIYYAGSVREAMGVVREFAKHGITTSVVHSKWTKKTDKINALAIERFRRGEVQILVNVQMLAMGFDVPKVETIIVARPVESDTLFTQMVGRGARPYAGKDKFILIDVHDTIYKPEVAKIFEHRHLFYSAAQESEVIRRRPGIAAPVVRLVPALPKNIGGFPYNFAQLEWPKPDVQALKYLTLQGQNVVVNYFFDYQTLKQSGHLFA